MAVFSKKGGGQSGGGVPLRWLPVGPNFSLLRLMFQASGSPSGPFRNPAYKSYISKVTNEPLDFLMPDRSIISARCVWIISGGRPSQHGFHLVSIAGGRENLQRLTGQEGVSSRHFTSEIIAAASREDQAAKSQPSARGSVPVKPKSKPAPKPVDDFSDLSGGTEENVAAKAQFPDELGRSKPARSPLAKTDLSDLESGGDLDFQRYDSQKPESPAKQDDGFLTDPDADLMVSTSGRTWSLDDVDESGTPAAKAPPAADANTDAAPDEMLELPEEPEAEPLAEPEMPEEPVAAATAGPVQPVEDEDPFAAGFESGQQSEAASMDAIPVAADEDPFAELDAAPGTSGSEAAETPSDENPFEDLDAGSQAAPEPESVASEAVTGSDEFSGAWDLSEQSPAPGAQRESAHDPEAVSLAQETASNVPVAVSSPPSSEWDLSDSAAPAQSPVMQSESAAELALQAEEMAAQVAGETVNADLVEPVEVSTSAIAEEEPVAISDSPAAASPEEFPDETGISDADIKPVSASLDGVSEADEPMFAEETEVALGEVESLTDPEALAGRGATISDVAPGRTDPVGLPDQLGIDAGDAQGEAYAHDDVAYLDGISTLPKNGEILSVHARQAAQLRNGEAPAPSGKFDELIAKGAPRAFDDEAVAIDDDVSTAEDLFGERPAKMVDFPEEPPAMRETDSEVAADMRYTNFNTPEETEKALAEAEAIMSAEEVFGGASEPVQAISGSTKVEPLAPSLSAPEPEPPAKPSGNWRFFTTEVSNELKATAKKAKVIERTADMLRFDLKVRVIWPGGELSDGFLCVKDRSPSLYLNATDIRKLMPEAEVEF